MSVHVSNSKMSLIWSQLWMYYNLPRCIPIIALCLMCISFLYFTDSYGWLYGMLIWLFVSVIFLDKLSQGILEKGMYRIHQGMVVGYFLSILGITLIYYGGNEFLSDYFLGTSFLTSSTSPENIKKNGIEEKDKENSTEFVSGLGNIAISPFYLSLILGLSFLSLVLMYLSSVVRCKTHISTEDRLLLNLNSL